MVRITIALCKTDMDVKLLLSQKLESVVSSREVALSRLQLCNQAQADARIILYLAHASSQVHKKALIRTTDSDIVILTISFFQQLDLTELRI